MRHIRLNPSGLLLACILGAGCSGSASVVTVTLFDPAHPLPSRPADAPVRMLFSQRPECPYDQIGTVSVERGGPLPSREITLAMQQRARAVGGDAIVGIIRGIEKSPQEEAPGSPSRAEGRSEGTLTGTVIRFRDANCTR